MQSVTIVLQGCLVVVTIYHASVLLVLAVTYSRTQECPCVFHVNLVLIKIWKGNQAATNVSVENMLVLLMALVLAKLVVLGNMQRVQVQAVAHLVKLVNFHQKLKMTNTLVTHLDAHRTVVNVQVRSCFLLL